MKIRLESTAEVGRSPGRARLWVGTTEDGIEVRAWITIGALTYLSTPPEVLRRTQQALETRIVSTADIHIPLPEDGR